MNETACQFGEHRRLAGIVATPKSGAPTLACIFVSAGLVPKFGPFRLYTLLARDLARRGLLTLRFDLGGIGDSRTAHGGLTLHERTRREIGAAVDHVMADPRVKGAVLVGLCSGAEDAFRYSEHDPRVTGVVMIDPFAYRTPGWAWRHALYRFTRRTLRLLRLYEPHNYRAVAAPGTGDSARPLVKYKYMAHDDSTRIVGALIARGTRMHFVYTGGAREAFNHRGQLKKMFRGVDFRGLVTLDHFPHTEHTQLLEEDRQLVIDAIVGRVADPSAASARR